MMYRIACMPYSLFLILLILCIHVKFHLLVIEYFFEGFNQDRFYFLKGYIGFYQVQ